LSRVTYQTALHNFTGIARHHIAEEAFNEYEKKPYFLYGMTVKRERHQEWITAEMKNPKAIELFKKYQRARPTSST
jgi:hypothetical protein